MKCSLISLQFSSVQSLSGVQLFATPWTTARQASLSITQISSSLLNTTQIPLSSSSSCPKNLTKCFHCLSSVCLQCFFCPSHLDGFVTICNNIACIPKTDGSLFFPYSLVQTTFTDLLTINSDLHHTSTKDAGIQKQNRWPWEDLRLMGRVISMHILSTWWVKNFSGWLFMVQIQTCCVKLLQLCPTLWDPIGYCLPGSYAHGILQARILHWVAMSAFRGSSWPRDWTHVSYV